MANSYRKRCSTSLIRKMQVITTVRDHKLLEWAIIKKIRSIGKDVEKRESLCTVNGNKICVATTGNSMEVPPKLKNLTTIWSSSCASVYLSEEKEKLTQKDIWTPTFIEAWCTITKLWKKLVYNNGIMNNENVIYMCVCVCARAHMCMCLCVSECVCDVYVILFSHKKEWNHAICNNLDGPSGHDIKWSKSDKKDHMISFIHGI